MVEEDNKMKREDGKIIKVNNKQIMRVGDKDINITGRFIKTARMELEWVEDIEDPASFIDVLKKYRVGADIFTFRQITPETRLRYNYCMELDSLAILHIQSFDHWWEKQIGFRTRNHAKQAHKKGVFVRVVDFDDELVKGIQQIYNETPFRQNKAFWHYRKDFDAVKEMNSTHLDKSEFIGAYHNGQLIGFIKFVYSQKTATTEQIISKIAHRDKSPTNALIAKAVEICENKRIPYLVYGYWSRDSLGEFKRQNGFEKIDLPRYYVPLTLKGKIFLKLRLHKGFRGLIPENLKRYLIGLRTRWYAMKYRNLSKEGK